MRRVGNEFRLEKPPRYEYADQSVGVTVFLLRFSFFQIDISRRMWLPPSQVSSTIYYVRVNTHMEALLVFQRGQRDLFNSQSARWGFWSSIQNHAILSRSFFRVVFLSPSLWGSARHILSYCKYELISFSKASYLASFYPLAIVADRTRYWTRRWRNLAQFAKIWYALSNAYTIMLANCESIALSLWKTDMDISMCTGTSTTVSQLPSKSIFTIVLWPPERLHTTPHAP